MKDIHQVYTDFRGEFPGVLEKYEELGRFLHEQGGPLDGKTRALVKLGISAAGRHGAALETQLERAREAGASEAEILHALLLLIPTCGFPTFMEAYATYKGR